MNEYSLYNPDSELAHHGILGMKWGVRRYQNQDGSLTPLGRKRFARSRNNRFVNAFDTMAAKKIYQKKSSKINSEAKVLSKMSEKEARKANELKDVDSEKASKHEHKANLYSVQSEAYKQASDILSQRVKDIDSGVLKAGEDFIVQVDKNWYGLFSTTEKRIVLNQKNDVAKQSPSPNNSDKTPREEKSSAAEPARQGHKSDMMETARKTGKYDIDFLESIQNSYVLEGPKEERLREYSKYLDNPRTYVAPPETRPSTSNKTRTDKLASRAKAMQGQYTQAEIAEKLGVSPSYVSSLLS